MIESGLHGIGPEKRPHTATKGPTPYTSVDEMDL
jgi:hypothetical protein